MNGELLQAARSAVTKSKYGVDPLRILQEAREAARTRQVAAEGERETSYRPPGPLRASLKNIARFADMEDAEINAISGEVDSTCPVVQEPHSSNAARSIDGQTSVGSRWYTGGRKEHHETIRQRLHIGNNSVDSLRMYLIIDIIYMVSYQKKYPETTMDDDLILYLKAYSDAHGSVEGLAHLGKILELIKHCQTEHKAGDAFEYLYSEENLRQLVTAVYVNNNTHGADALALAISEGVIDRLYGRNAINRLRTYDRPGNVAIEPTGDAAIELCKLAEKAKILNGVGGKQGDTYSHYTYNSTLVDSDGIEIGDGEDYRKAAHAIFPNFISAAFTIEEETRSLPETIGTYILLVGASGYTLEALAGRFKRALEHRYSYTKCEMEMPKWPPKAIVAPPKILPRRLRRGLARRKEASWWQVLVEGGQPAGSTKRADELAFLDQYYHGNKVLNPTNFAIMYDVRSYSKPVLPSAEYSKPVLPSAEAVIEQNNSRGDPVESAHLIQHGGAATLTASFVANGESWSVVREKEMGSCTLYNMEPLINTTIALGIMMGLALLVPAMYILATGSKIESNVIIATTLFAGLIAWVTGITVLVTQMRQSRPASMWHGFKYGRLVVSEWQPVFTSDVLRDEFVVGAYRAGVDTLRPGADCVSSEVVRFTGLSAKFIDAPGIRTDMLGNSRSGNIFRVPKTPVLLIQEDWYMPEKRAWSAAQSRGYDWPKPELFESSAPLNYSHATSLPLLSIYSLESATYVGNAQVPTPNWMSRIDGLWLTRYDCGTRQSIWERKLVETH
jgi:hypothetical protein